MFLATEEGRDLQGEAQFYLGEYYSGYERYDLAEKYWLMAAENGFVAAWSGLGDIYSFDESLKRDYKKAFEFYSKGAELDNLYCKYRIAEMYRDGLFVKADPNKHKEIIEELYNLTKDNEEHWQMYPDIAFRYSEILNNEGRNEELTELYSELIVKFEEFIAFRRFTGSIKDLLKTIDRYYQLVDFDEDEMDIYTVSYMMKKPVRIQFMYDNRFYEIESIDDKDGIIVRFGDKWFRSVEDFYLDAKIGSDSITSLAEDIDFIEVIS